MEELPNNQTDFHHAKPIYETLPGWRTDISGAREFDDLPSNAQAYVRFVAEQSGCRVGDRRRPGPVGDHQPARSADLAVGLSTDTGTRHRTISWLRRPPRVSDPGHTVLDVASGWQCWSR